MRPRFTPRTILEKLNEDDELPFGGYRKGLGIDSRGLAKLLKPFGIRPKAIRARRGHTPRGTGARASPTRGSATAPSQEGANGTARCRRSIRNIRTTAPQSQKRRFPIRNKRPMLRIANRPKTRIPMRMLRMLRIETANPGPDTQTARCWSGLYRRGPRYEPGHPRNRPGHAQDHCRCSRTPRR